VNKKQKVMLDFSKSFFSQFFWKKSTRAKAQSEKFHPCLMIFL